MARLVSETGLRSMECAQLLIREIDFGDRQIAVHKCKGAKDRFVIATQIYSHVLQRAGSAVRSPVYALPGARASPRIHAAISGELGLG